MALFLTWSLGCVLLLAAVVRINGLSLLYLCAFLATIGSTATQFRAIVSIAVAVSAAAVVGQVVFQLVADTDLSPASSSIASTWYQLGFVPLKQVQVWYHVARFVGPDVAVLASAAACKCMFSRRTADPRAARSQRGERMPNLRVGAGAWSRTLDFSAFFVCLWTAGLSLPAVIPLAYVVYSGCVLVFWSRTLPTTARFNVSMARLRKPLVPYTALHIILVYVFQLHSVQQGMLEGMRGPGGDLAETLGLPVLINGTAMTTPEWYEWNVLPVSWVVWIHVVALGLLYFICAHAHGVAVQRLAGRSPGTANTPLLPLADRNDSVRYDDDEPACLAPSAADGTWRTQAALLLPYACLALITIWAVVFPSWLSFVLLLWANVHWLLPLQVYAQSVQYLFAYVFGLVLLDYLVSIRHALPETSQAYSTPKDDAALAFLSLAGKAVVLVTVALSCRLQNSLAPTTTGSHHYDPVTQNSSLGTDNAQSGSLDTQKYTLTAATARAGLGVLVSQAYLVTFIIVYAAALERVEILNAVYLVMLTAFMSFPSMFQKGWLFLVVYCQLAITLQYMWGFDALQGAFGGPNSTAILVIGLDEDSHSHLWLTLRWHLAILVLSLLQLSVIRSRQRNTNEKTAQHSSHGSGPAAVRHSNQAEDSSGEDKAAPAVEWRQLGNYLLCRCWVIVVIGLVVIAQLNSDISLIGIGYIVVLFVILFFVQLRLYGIAKRMVYLALIYSAAVFIVKYLYQFESVSRTAANVQGAQSKLINGSGLKFYAETNQAGRFWYLFPSTLIFVACVIQIRLQHTHAPSLPQSSVVFRGPARYGRLFVHGVQRLMWLDGDVLVAIVAFYACLWPRPDCAGMVTVIIVLVGLCTSAVRTSHVFLCLWIEIVVVAKLLYQLHYWELSDSQTAVSRWLGLEMIDSGRGLSVIHTLMPLLFGLATILLRDFAHAFSPDDAWPAHTIKARRTLFDTPTFGNQVPVVLATPFHYMGRQICLIAVVCAAFVKLNIVGLIYFCLGSLGACGLGGNAANIAPSDTERARYVARRYWVWLLVAMVFLVYQYASFVGLPPSVPYPYMEWAVIEERASIWRKSLLRWAALPPLQAGTAGAHNVTTSQIVVANAPLAWSDPTSVIMDVILVVCLRLQLKSLWRVQRDRCVAKHALTLTFFCVVFAHLFAEPAVAVVNQLQVASSLNPPPLHARVM